MKEEVASFYYLTTKEFAKYAFYMIPKELFTNPNYKNISTDAKLLYGLLRDRNQLSIKNNWIDKENHIYIIFTRKEVRELLNFGNKYTTKVFKELIEVNLIKEVRQGLNKPNIIYVGDIIPQHIDITRKCLLDTSRSVRKTLPEVSKRHLSNTDISNTNNNNKSVSSLVPAKVEKSKKEEQTNELTNLFKQSQLELFEDVALQENIRQAIKTSYDDNKTQSIIRKIKLEHVDEAVRRYREAQEEEGKKIKNPKLYFRKCLLSAVEECGLDNIY